MSIEDRVRGYSKIFGDWVLDPTPIGSGSNGKTVVFRITRENLIFTENGAVKAINIVKKNGKLKELSQEDRLEYEAEQQALCKRAEEELRTMNRVGSFGNIVSYHDHRFEHWEKEYDFGTDLLIRMDLLETLSDLKKKKVFDEAEILKMALDISTALVDCHKKDVWHRDIKPHNIFYSKDREAYLLGDFGIAKIVEEQERTETCTGTKAYAAPEQFLGN